MWPHGGTRAGNTSDSEPPEVKAARELAVTVWNTQLTTLSQLNLSVDDPALVIAEVLGWLVMAADDAAVVRGQVDPRPPTVTAFRITRDERNYLMPVHLLS